MKASTVIALAAGFTATLVSAQDISSIPQCALSCALNSLGSTGCQTTDIPCICKATSFVTSLIPCVQGACSAAEFENTVVAARGLCSAAGVTLDIPTGGASSSAAPSTSAAPTSSAVSSAVSSITTVVTTTAASNTSIPAPTGNGTVTQPPSPSGTDDSAAGRNAVALGGLGAVVALVAALL